MAIQSRRQGRKEGKVDAATEGREDTASCHQPRLYMQGLPQEILDPEGVSKSKESVNPNVYPLNPSLSSFLSGSLIMHSDHSGL